MRLRVLALVLLGTAYADPGTQPHELDNTNPPESTDSKCRSCHAGGTDDDGKYFRPWDSWAGTMMSQSARDPLYLAALTVAQQDSPGIETYCWRCHSPSAFVKGNAPASKLDADDLEGVSCDACHRSFDPSKSMPVVDPKGPYVGNGYLFWDSSLVKHGNYPDADSPAHTTVQDPFTSSSELCGQCHELSNPKVMMDGTQTPFPLDTTYTEWANSAFKTTKGCVDCHMRPAKGDLQLSTYPSAKSRTNPRTHYFVGANVWGIDSIKAAEPMLAKARALAFDNARAEALATLQAAVNVEIGVPLDVKKDKVSTTVRVTNLTGHKFPTGYADGRRAFLRVELVGSSVLAKDETHVYEAVHEQKNPKKDFHIALSNIIAKDTRIPPKGFKPGPTTPVIGATFGDGFEDVPVSFSIPMTDTRTFTIRATVLYESTTPEMIDELAKSNTTDTRGQTLKTIFATLNALPVPVASAEAQFSLDPISMPQPMNPMTPKNGCSCNTSSSSASGALALLALLFLRRRR